MNILVKLWGKGSRCGKSGFTVNRGAVNRGITVKVFISFKEIYFSFRVSRARCAKHAMQAMKVP